MLLHGQVAPWCVEKGWGGGIQTVSKRRRDNSLEEVSAD